MSFIEPQRSAAEVEPPPPDVDENGLLLPGVEAVPRRQRRRGRSLLRVLALIPAVIVAGGLVGALIVPWVAVPAVAGQAGYGLLSPREGAVLDRTPLGNTRILAHDGSPITQLYRRNRVPVPAEAIAPVMKMAVVAIEDARFYRHDGVDLEGLARALSRNVVAGDVVQGGSTVTQQLVKQIRLQTAAGPTERRAAVAQSLGRKLQEAQLAMALEQRHTKDEILTRYLNRVYFGAGAYGVEAAALRYFGVPAARLTLPQAATLAGLVQSPAAYDPFTAPERATARRDVVLTRMLDLGMITSAAAAEARATPLDVSAGRPAPNGCLAARIGPFFCDHVLTWLEDEVGLTLAELEAGGYTIRTTLGPGAQRAAETAIARVMSPTDPRAAVYTAVQPGTGRILAMAVNRRYGLDPADPAQTTVNLNTAAGQGTGSTYKVFTAAAALARGFGLEHRIRTGDPYRSRVFEEGDEPYEVSNAGRYPEDLTLEEALYMSSNTYFLALQDQLGSVEGPVRMAQRLGLTSLDPVADRVVAENRGSFTFGAEATSPLALTNAYATLAERGLRCAPRPVEEILGPDGEPAVGPDGAPLMPPDRCTQVIRPGLADALNRALLKDVMPGHPGQTGARAHVPGYQIAGKTGTSQDRYSATFVGYTPGFAASVMLYDPRRNRDVGSFGGGIPAGIWRDAAAPVLRWLPQERFVPPPAVFVEGTRPPAVAGGVR